MVLFMAKRTQRRLAAIVAADVVGYSRLMSSDEEGTLAALKAARSDVFDPYFAEHGGRVVKTTGDGLLAEFPSVLDAVRCCVEVQQSLLEQATSVPEDRQLRFRIGINLGDIIFDGDDIYGDGVNVAARLEAMAEPGGVCVSDDVVRQIRGKLNVAFTDDGYHDLKNIAEPVHVWRWSSARLIKPAIGDVPEPVRAGMRQHSQVRRADAKDDVIDFSQFDRAPIVVLPFRDLGGSDQDCLGEGLRLSLHSVLIKLSGLFLLHTAAVESYRGRDLSAAEIGREINVNYVVSGAVQRAGNRVRILVELTDVGTGQVIWADRLDRTLEDIFDFQDEVTQEIVNAIGLKLRGGDARRACFITAGSAETLALLHRAVSHLYRGTREDTAIAREWGEKLLAAEPNNPSTLGLIALTHWREAKFCWTDDPGASLERAAEYAERTIARGDPEGIGHTIIGYVHLLQRRYDDALAASTKARARRPSCPMSNGVLAEVMRFYGNPDQAVLRMRDAMRLARNFPPWMVSGLAASLRDSGEIDASIEAASEAMRLFPEDIDCQVTLCCDKVFAGSAAEARQVAELIRRADPSFSISHYVASQPYRDQVTLDGIMECLKRAGLPE
jgi:adenylate cyclase